MHGGGCGVGARVTLGGIYRGPLRTIGPEQLSACEASGRYVAEQKFDGEWCCLSVRGGAIVSATSRSGLDLDSAWWVSDLRLGPGLLEAEIHGESMECGRIHVWDLVSCGGHDLRAVPLEDRRATLERLHAAILPGTREDLPLVERRHTGFARWYAEILERGGEGLILKARGSSLATGRQDGKLDHWLKCKPRSVRAHRPQ